MPSRRMRLVACGIVLLICTTAFLHRSTSHVDLSRLSNVHHLWSSDETTHTYSQAHSDLRILEPAQFENQSDFACINATLGNLNFPMCFYDPQSDVYISKETMAGQYFEARLVQKLVNFFRIHPDMSFVDLGANLGAYSLPIAHSGIHVVAVEPNKDTVRRLAKSVHLGRIENNIDIFHCALSNEESTTFLKFTSWNRGDTFMAENGSCPGCMSVNVTVLNKLIPFIRHKKAFIKIDAQEAEIKIIQEQSAAKFLSEIDVVMIQIEWDLFRKRYGTTEDKRRKIDRFLQFFYHRGYEVYDPRTEQKLGNNWTIWSYDVLFKKADLPKTQLFHI